MISIALIVVVLVLSSVAAYTVYYGNSSNSIQQRPGVFTTTSCATSRQTCQLAIQSNPKPGNGAIAISVDGESNNLAGDGILHLTLARGNHTISASNFGTVLYSQSGCPNYVYQFSSWSDGGAQVHQINLQSNVTLTVSYNLYKTVC